jgi:hypothetical protein
MSVNKKIRKTKNRMEVQALFLKFFFHQNISKYPAKMLFFPLAIKTNP